MFGLFRENPCFLLSTDEAVISNPLWAESQQEAFLKTYPEILLQLRVHSSQQTSALGRGSWSSRVPGGREVPGAYLTLWGYGLTQWLQATHVDTGNIQHTNAAVQSQKLQQTMKWQDFHKKDGIQPPPHTPLKYKIQRVWANSLNRWGEEAQRRPNLLSVVPSRAVRKRWVVTGCWKKRQKSKQGPLVSTMKCPPALKFSEHFGWAKVSPSTFPLPGCPFPFMNAAQETEANVEGKLFRSTRNP